MLREMTGRELMQWRAWFTLKDEEREERERAQKLDQKGKQNLRKMLRG